MLPRGTCRQKGFASLQNFLTTRTTRSACCFFFTDSGFVIYIFTVRHKDRLPRGLGFFLSFSSYIYTFHLKNTIIISKLWKTMHFFAEIPL